MSFWEKVQKITARIARGKLVRGVTALDEYLFIL